MSARHGARRRPTTLAAAAAAALVVGAALAAGTTPDDGAAATSIESCVSRDALAVRAGEPRTLLDAADRRRVHAAMVARYPVLLRDGVEPSHIVLWRRGAGEWLYVTLLADPARRGAPCYTATFAAGVFEFTGALLRKYFHVAA